MIAFVVAYDRNRVMGKENGLPWKIPEDVKFFKQVTMGHAIVMGRKTYESIGKPLPGRKNIIITRNKKYTAEGCEVFHSLEEVMETYPEQDLYVIGGAEIFKMFFPIVDRLYITYIDAEFEGDTYFPQFNKEEWKLISKEKGIKNEKNPYDYWFLMYERK